MLTLADPLEHACRIHAERLAAIDGERRLTYAELHRRSHQLGSGLRQLGVKPGERVALLSANSHRYIEAFFGVPSHGMILVPLNTRLAQPELLAILRDCQPRVLISDRDPGPLAAAVERMITIPEGYESLLSAAPASPRPQVAESDVAVLFYTGGTTGLPKGVMLTHRNLISNAFHKTVACSLREDEVFLAAPAMFHVAGVAPLVSLVWLGARSVILPSFDPERCLDAIQNERVTLMIPVPTMLGTMIASQRLRPRDLSSLRMVGHAGSPIARELIEAASRTFANAELAQFYGATETSSVVTVLRNEQRTIGTARLGSAGHATPGVAVRVVDATDDDCAPGEVGEILVRGPNVTVGYWNNPDATSAALRGGWYHTGDLGSLDESGHLFVVDRLKDMIVSGAENVYSIEVEDVLHRHPAVVEAAVFGVPDATWGEAVHAIVVLSPGAAAVSGDELREHCRKAIAGYKVPKQIEIQLEPLPKSGPGKILKRVLRDRYWPAANPGRR
ncbi:MAG TPA: long-chain-fatty-acid--CoA ligase [Polyangiales bacterium]|nr:long-chain-fatty-acid--CoA ligase [Polyangiales bacterium]